MTEIERDRLLNLSIDEKYKKAVGILFDKPANDIIKEDHLDALMTEVDAELLFDTPRTSGWCFTFLLKKLLPYLQRSLGEDLVSQKIA